MIEISSIGKSNGNLDIPIVKITDNKSNESRRKKAQKPIIFIVGR
jgi:hypothetical protein